MPSAPESRYRRRVLGIAGAGAFLLYVVGAPIFNNRIENDLEHRVPAALAAAGYGTIDAKFSGQEGTLTCPGPLGDPEGALAVVHGVRGVYSVELDRGCRVNTGGDVSPSGTVPGASTGSSASSGTPETSLPDFATVGAVVTGDPQFAMLARLAGQSGLATTLADPSADPVTVFAPTDAAFAALPAGPSGQLDDDAELRTVLARGHVVVGTFDDAALAALDGGTVTTIDGVELPVAVEGDVVTVGGATVTGSPIVTPNGVVYTLAQVILPEGLDGTPTGSPVAATLAGGTLTLHGAVGDQLARDTLVFAGTAAVGPDRLDNQLVLDSDTGLDADDAAQLATLIAVLNAELVSGAAGHDGTGFYLSGAYANTADAARAEAAADAADAVTHLAPRRDANATEAAALEDGLNEFVRANPITFGQGSAVLNESAATVLDRLAARLVELGGLTVVVEGHTDSDGQAASNQSLSEQRAGVVRQALIDRGVESDIITAAGFGSQRPVLSASGIEDKTASRRVEFRISAG
ncbi:MAG TPA: fasciclin domain-containing protein [Ilumatobacter sp.]|nr:fasciclin domain-containing protein [Ilumatobacter sp.]